LSLRKTPADFQNNYRLRSRRGKRDADFPPKDQQPDITTEPARWRAIDGRPGEKPDRAREPHGHRSNRSERPYDFALGWTPDNFQNTAGNAGPALDGTPIFTALQEQLGLRLESQRGPAELLIVDKVERPSPD
jgi:hypothetical protein